MKVVGFMNAWQCSSMIEHSIENHLKICDELYVSVSSHAKKFDCLEDDTLEKVKKYNVNIVNYKRASETNCNVSKCHILNNMIRDSELHVDDVIMICDADEIYDDIAITEIKDNFKLSGWDTLQVTDRFFVIDGNWYVNTDGHWRFHRVRPGCNFVPTQRIVPPARSTKQIIKNCPMFHYSMLMGHNYKKAHWQSEGNINDSKVRWLEEIYFKWDPNDIDLCNNLARKNQEITGVRGFWCNNGVVEKPEAPYIFEYTESHPININVFKETK